MHTHLLSALTLNVVLASAWNLPWRRSVVEPYAPYTTTCPSTALTRDAKGLNTEEKAYIEQRLPKASEALATWLTKNLDGVSTKHLPTLALSLSGGGQKAGLTTAGAMSALDARESEKTALSGLLQSFTYISALSGGSLTLSGVMANDFAQISSLKTKLYDQNYQNNFKAVLAESAQVRADVGNKTAAGYPATLVDIYGRSISYNFIDGSSAGGNDLLWSNVTVQASFKDSKAPYPIITITQANVGGGMCKPNHESAIWEVAPFEFGSWDDSVSAFFPTKYMGTKGTHTTGKCTAGYDNIGFIAAVSSNILIPWDGRTNCTSGNGTADNLNSLSSLITQAFPQVGLVNPYGIIPDPFYQSPEAGIVRDQHAIFGADGGDSGQGVPIFPWLQPERDIDVIFVIDAETHLPHNITNGTSVYNTYTSAQRKGLTRMPKVPSPEEVVLRNLSARAHFYGCYDADVATLIYTPNTELGNITANSFQYTPKQIDAAFDGGIDMVTQDDDPAWARCVACAIVHKTASKLPDSCNKCLETYCWPRNTTVSILHASGAAGSGNASGSGVASPTASPTAAYTGAANGAYGSVSIGGLSLFAFGYLVLDALGSSNII